jgi:hypothetical protein
MLLQSGQPVTDCRKGTYIDITIGERADIMFTPMGKDPIHLEWHDISRGRHNAFYKEDGSIGLQHQHQMASCRRKS